LACRKCVASTTPEVKGVGLFYNEDKPCTCPDSSGLIPVSFPLQPWVPSHKLFSPFSAEFFSIVVLVPGSPSSLPTCTADLVSCKSPLPLGRSSAPTTITSAVPAFKAVADAGPPQRSFVQESPPRFFTPGSRGFYVGGFSLMWAFFPCFPCGDPIVRCADVFFTGFWTLFFLGHGGLSPLTSLSL